MPSRWSTSNVVREYTTLFPPIFGDCEAQGACMSIFLPSITPLPFIIPPFSPLSLYVSLVSLLHVLMVGVEMSEEERNRLFRGTL